jgi:hypothetical protein
MAEREHAIFEAANSIETPLGIDDSLGALALGECIGREFGEKFRREPLVGGEVLGWEHVDACGQAVTGCVQAGFLLSDIRAGPRTLLGVAAVGFYLDHVEG